MEIKEKRWRKKNEKNGYEKSYWFSSKCSKSCFKEIGEFWVPFVGFEFLEE